MNVTRVMVVGGARLDRELLCRVIAAQDGLCVACVAAPTADAVALVGTMEPDVVVVDAASSALRSLAVLDFVRNATRLSSRVLVLGALDDPGWLTHLAQCGLAGFLPTTSSVEDLLAAIRRVGGGRCAFDVESLRTLVESVASRGRSSELGKLTKRERDVLALVAKGLSSKEVAAVLDLSPRTIETHRMNIMHKLDLHNGVQLALFAIREGLASPFDASAERTRRALRRHSIPVSNAWQKSSSGSMDSAESRAGASIRGVTA